MSCGLRGSLFLPRTSQRQMHVRALHKKHELFVAPAFPWRLLCVQGACSRTPDPSWEQHRNTQHMNNLLSIS